MWIICFAVALLFLFAGILIAGLSVSRRWRSPHPASILLTGTFLTAVSAFLPLYRDFFSNDAVSPIKIVFVSVNNSIRLFVVDCDFGSIREMLTDAPAWANTAYSVLFSVLYVLCPILTFGFVLSFFKTVSAYRRLFFSFRRDFYVFSELNQKNLALATSVRETNGRAVIVFTHVDTDADGFDDSLADDANKLGAICFKKDLLSVQIPERKRQKVFFVIQGDDTNANIATAIALTEKRKNPYSNETLYFFDDTATGAALFSRPATGGLVVRHINAKRALIYKFLYSDGKVLFDTAVSEKGSSEKLISALIVGLGQYGAEMLKTLTWACQMYGYRLKINGFDYSDETISRFKATCPGLFDPAINGQNIVGDAQYDIRLYGGIDAQGEAYETAVCDHAKDATFVFISLGTDEANVAVAYRTREIFERIHASGDGRRVSGEPFIQTVIYDPATNQRIGQAKNRKGLAYDIHCIGSLDSFYSFSTFFDTELEKEALLIHRAYGDTDENFYYDDYNYNSSFSSAMHRILRRKCGMPATDREALSRMTPEEQAVEKRALALLEHRRWSAYVRGDGYRIGGSQDERKNDTLARLHYCLIPFDELPPEEQEKDYNVIA